MLPGVSQSLIDHVHNTFEGRNIGSDYSIIIDLHHAIFNGNAHGAALKKISLCAINQVS
jgi:hypothetical protein